MKIFFLLLIIIPLLITSQAYRPEDWTVFSNYMVINDIDGDINYVYAATAAGILAVDKFTDEITPLIAFRDYMIDIPFKNLIADPYESYNLYFTGRDYVYRYSWFFDTLYASKIGAISAKQITRFGVDEKYIYAAATGQIFRCDKNFLEDTMWAVTADTANVYWGKDNSDFDKYTMFMPLYTIFGNKERAFTCHYEDLGYMWAGTDGGGIVKINQTDHSRKTISTGTGNLDNRVIVRDSTDALWISGYNAFYIVRHKPDSNSFIYYPIDSINEIPDNQIVSGAASKDNVLFTTMKGQAFFFSYKDMRFHSINNENSELIFRSAALDNDRFIISNEQGPAMVDIAMRKFTQNDTVSFPSVIDIECWNDSVYIVSNNTLYVSHTGMSGYSKCEYDFPTFRIFQYFRNENAEIILDNAYVHYRIDPDTFISDPVIGMFGDFYDMDYDGRYIWTCGSDGVGKYDIKNKYWTVYNRNNSPLTRNLFFSIETYNGRIYAGTKNALVRYKYINQFSND